MTRTNITSPMASPSTYTTAWSATVPGLVRKKKPKVIWKKEMEVMIVFADMSAILVAFLEPGLPWKCLGNKVGLWCWPSVIWLL